MRIAPIPLYGVAQNRIADVKALDELAADAARLTHQHPLGYIPAALLAHVIYGLAADEHPTRDNLTGIVRDGLRVMEELFPHPSRRGAADAAMGGEGDSPIRKRSF